MASIYEYNGQIISYPILDKFLENARWSFHIDGNSFEDALKNLNNFLNEEKKETVSIIHNGAQQAYRMMLYTWVETKIELDDGSTEQIKEMVSVICLPENEERTRWHFYMDGVVGWVDIRDAIMMILPSLGMKASVKNGRALYERWKNYSKRTPRGILLFDKELKKYSNANKVIALYRVEELTHKTYLDERFVKTISKLLWEDGAYQEDNFRLITPPINENFKPEFTNVLPSLPSRVKNKVQTIIDTYNLQLTTNDYVCVLSDTSFNKVFIEVIYDFAKSTSAVNAQEKFLYRNEFINTNIAVEIVEGESTSEDVDDWTVIYQFNNAWPDVRINGYSFNPAGAVSKYYDEDYVRQAASLGSFQFRTNTSEWYNKNKIYIWDNFIDGHFWHRETGVDIVETALKPTTYEEAINTEETYEQWYDMKSPQQYSLFLTNFYTDKDFMTETPLQTIAWNGTVYPVVEGLQADVTPFVAGLAIDYNDEEEDDDGKPINPSYPPANPELPTGTDTPGIQVPGSTLGVGFYRAYNPTKNELSSLNDWLWSDDIFDSSNWGKLFASPMEAIISLKAIYCGIAGSHIDSALVGHVSSGVGMNLITSQYTVVDCGTVAVNELFHNALDYNSYTKIQIFLPFIGVQDLDTDEVMNGMISLQYIVDVLTGDCVALLNITNPSTSGVLYTFEGNCAQEIPISASNATNFELGAAFGTVGGAVAGAMMGGIPGAVAGAVGGLMSNKLQVQKSGSLSGNHGVMGCKTPYLIIQRPIQAEASLYETFYGRPCNRTVKLGSMSGFVKVKSIHLDGLGCTDAEAQELEQILTTEGIIV